MNDSQTYDDDDDDDDDDDSQSAAVPQATTHKIRTSVQHDVQFLQDLPS
ncbi:hypothetical protein T4D_1282 [Trichinella pseudospiralis]|uniref:Uncharacterized protein n=1 Tax=Trichinella pseudospiralis TaxID=6337 RepID=A0A0V1FIP2_TRIPS|nr:hypothetical protein T4D_1282 [Trichinella pseudospiralis]